MFSGDFIYIQVFANRFLVRNVDSGESRDVTRNQTYASPRMLIADFTVAAKQIKDAVKSVRRRMWAPEILMHPMELIEGGVTQVEYRVFVELGVACGASKTAVYSGAPLSGDAVKRAIREYKH